MAAVDWDDDKGGTGGGKLLTVVVPAYNMEDYLPQCLDSLAGAAGGGRLEAIVVDDGSTDGTAGIIRRYAQAMPGTVKAISKPNGHYGSCVNAGLAAATGKYFKILDADDWFDTAALEELLRRLEACETDLVVTLRVDEIFKGGRRAESVRHPFASVPKGKVMPMEGFSLQDHVRESEWGMNGLAYRTGLLRSIGFRLPEGIHYTDTLYCFLPFPYVKDFVVFDLYLYHYRLGREGQSVDPGALRRNLAHIVQVTEEVFGVMDGTAGAPGWVRRGQRFFLQGAVNFCLQSLKMQRGIRREDYPRLERLARHIKAYGVRHDLLRRWYLRAWRATGSAAMLDMALRLRSLFAGRKQHKA